MNEKKLPLEHSPAKIIKAKNQKPASVFFGSVVKHQILNAAETARSMMQTARKNAENLIADAEISAAEICREAYQNGRETAENEFAENLLAIKSERFYALLTVEQDVLKLSVKLAEKIIGREIEQDENARAEIVSNALRHARQQEMLTVRVNAADLPRLEQMREENINAFGRAKYIDFVADQAIIKGGCIIESASGTIDARLETQLRILENALLARASDEARED